MRKKSTGKDSLHLPAEEHLTHVSEAHLANGLMHELQARQAELELQNEQLRQAQIELKKSRDRFADLYDFAPVGYLTLDHEGMIREINLTGADLLGIDRSELHRPCLASFVVMEDKDRWLRHLMDVLKRDDTQTCELTLQRGDGSCFYAELDCLRLKEDGKRSVVRIAFIDVARRNAIGGTFKESERFFSTLIKNSPVGICRTDTRGNDVYNNERCRKITGQTAVEKHHTGWLQAIHSDDRKKVIRAWRTSVKAHQDFIMEWRIQHPEGSIRWMLGQATAERNASGKVVGYVGTLTDITQSKKTEIQQAELLSLLHGTLESTADAILVVDLHNKWVLHNQKFVDLWQIADEIIASRDDKAALSYVLNQLEDPDGFLCRVHELYVTPEASSFDTIQFKNGKVIERHSIPQRIDGNVVGRVWSFRDITECKQAELRAAALIHRNQVFMQSTPEFVHILDNRGNVIEVNDAFCRHLGYTQAEALQLNVLDFDAKFSADEAQAIIDKLWGSHATFESVHRCKNGTLVDVEVTVSGVELNGQEYLFALGRDITERKQAEEEIKNLAFYDTLTHLPNRRLLTDRLSQALASSARSGQKGALLYVDLDKFKTLNDSLGHDIGDLLLQQVAQRLESCIREGDTVARLGGDEFVVMLKDLSKNETEAASLAEIVGEKILAALNQPYQLAAHVHHNTPSIGVTLFGDSGLSLDELLQQADIAMYQAKSAGRNVLRFFDPVMQAAITERALQETELRHAVAELDQFRLYYQVQIDSSGRSIGVEALVRWQHPTRGMMLPDEFIPLAEETGLILPLGHWVLASACRQLAAWAGQPKAAYLTVAVNVSAKQFHLPTFVEEVLTLVDHYGVDPSKLKLEITESMLLDNVENTIANMTVLKACGISFSLDDFGTGYSSLQYLKRLPLDQIKIDQSFVHDIVTDDSDKTIVRTIIAMAQGLNLNVIAEGVETVAQRQLLLDRGCTTFQGYLLGRPVPIEKFDALLKRGDRGNSIDEQPRRK